MNNNYAYATVSGAFPRAKNSVTPTHPYEPTGPIPLSQGAQTGTGTTASLQNTAKHLYGSEEEEQKL